VTLDYVAKEFGKTNYDIKWLFRTITATSLYQAPSGPRRNPDQTPMQHNVAQRLRGTSYSIIYSTPSASASRRDRREA